MIDLTEITKKDSLTKLGEDLFAKWQILPAEIRQDDKNRPGMKFIIKVPRTKNILGIKVFNPTDIAEDFASEKSARTDLLGHATSQDSEDVSQNHHRGCVSYYDEENGIVYHASGSGAPGSVDVTFSLILLSSAINVSISSIIQNIRDRDGMLPEEIFTEGHYLKTFLDECW